MSIKVYIDGSIHDERDASISVFDRGFLYGDSVYEVTRTSGGRPVDLTPHLDRLDRSCASIAMPLVPRATILDAITKTLVASGNAESYIRIIVTRGAGEVGLDIALADRPRLVVMVKPLVLPDAAQYRDGVAVALVEVRRTPRRSVDPTVKSGNYLNNILALTEAKRSGAFESIMCNVEGFVVEGSTSNVFVVKAGVVCTPPLEDGLLAGITRSRVLELARAAGMAVDERHLRPDDVRDADEVFLTSSVRGLLPVTKVDGRALGEGAPGPLTRRLLSDYEAFLARVSTDGV